LFQTIKIEDLDGLDLDDVLDELLVDLVFHSEFSDHFSLEELPNIAIYEDQEEMQAAIRELMVVQEGEPARNTLDANLRKVVFKGLENLQTRLKWDLVQNLE
jgi:hypothetical protein